MRYGILASDYSSVSLAGVEGHMKRKREKRGEIMPKFNANDKARHGIFIHKHELQQDKYSIQKIS